MTSEVESIEKWKDKKQRNKGKKLKKGQKVFVRRRKWRDEVDEIKELVESYENFDVAKAESFNDYPLSSKTKMGLEKAGYVTPTAIQKASFSAAIKGNDILGAAKTGSGKTLAFLIPVLECLYRERWSSIAGPGAMIISPTRELAYQTFEVLKKVGQFHDFSAGLVIGGKDIKTEADHMTRTNILICTPGRLLQHMDETSYFDALNLQILVLDEADRILDLGFKATLNAIIENLPEDKQTLLFSATQTTSVKDLARLSLKNPAYVSVHEKSKASTPSGLNQKYIICKLQDKMNILFSFVKTHLKTKTLVFLSSCKQVQYVYAAFCKLRPGVPVMMLHGRMNQLKRMAVYDEFCRKQFSLLFCTDIAARGLDFPAVDWVIQMDCPEDAETYIHRAGRTARYHGEGHALLFLLDSEQQMVEQLESKRVPIGSTEINSEKLTQINSRLESFCAADQELKQKAQRCFVSYLRSVFLMKNKSVFSVQSLPLAEYSASLGLAITPRVRFLQRHAAQKEKSASKVNVDKNMNITNKNREDNLPQQFDLDVAESKGEVGEMFAIKRKDIFSSNPSTCERETGKENETTLELKQKEKQLSKVQATKKMLKKKYKYNQKIVFGEEGEVKESWPPVDPEIYTEEDIDDKDEDNGIDIEQAKLQMQERDREDRQRHREKIRERHKEKRRKEKELRRNAQEKKEGKSKRGDDFVAYLGDDNGPDSSSEPKTLNENDSEDEQQNMYQSDSGVSDENCEEIAPKRRKMNTVDGRKSGTLSDLMSDAGMSLAEEESLALHLLGKR